MSKIQVSSCPQCGAPIYSPVIEYKTSSENLERGIS